MGLSVSIPIYYIDTVEISFCIVTDVSDEKHQHTKSV